MKKRFYVTHWLVMIMFIIAIGTKTQAQQLEYPSAKDAIKSVLWELAKDAGNVTCPPALLLTAMEILTIDAQAYADVARGIYWASDKNRQYEYNWGDRVVLVVPPQGTELREVLKVFRDAGCLSEAEIEEVRTMLKYNLSETPLTIDELPISVQDKIKAAIKLSVSKNRSEIIKKVKIKVSSLPIDIAGGWVVQGPPPADPGKPCQMIREGDNLYTLINERGGDRRRVSVKGNTLIDGAGNVIATISNGGNRINFNNNTWWER